LDSDSESEMVERIAVGPEKEVLKAQVMIPLI
jgi:hypothetical protein